MGGVDVASRGGESYFASRHREAEGTIQMKAIILAAGRGRRMKKIG